MTDRSKLLALADAVEKLTGPDREVDAEIYAITSEAIDYQRIGLKLSDASRLDRWHDGWVTVCGDKGQNDPYPEDLKPYTGSLDAAMTLVPDDWNWKASDHKRRGPVGIVENGELAFAGVALRPNPARRWFEVRAATPAISLCAAALRAQAEALA